MNKEMRRYVVIAVAGALTTFGIILLVLNSNVLEPSERPTQDATTTPADSVEVGGSDDDHESSDDGEHIHGTEEDLLPEELQTPTMESDPSEQAHEADRADRGWEAVADEFGEAYVSNLDDHEAWLDGIESYLSEGLIERLSISSDIVESVPPDTYRGRDVMETRGEFWIEVHLQYEDGLADCVIGIAQIGDGWEITQLSR